MTPKRKYMAPTYITEQLEELALLKNGWYWESEGRKIKRTSLHAAHQRFREYDGPPVILIAKLDGRIQATFEPTIKGHQHEDEIL
jgi:hypothetical protein